MDSGATCLDEVSALSVDTTRLELHSDSHPAIAPSSDTPIAAFARYATTARSADHPMNEWRLKVETEFGRFPLEEAEMPMHMADGGSIN
jgi:hypothetical protein